MDGEQARKPTTFIIRASQDGEGRLSGIVERVRTGQKECFEGPEALARVVAELLKAEGGEPSKP